MERSCGMDLSLQLYVPLQMKINRINKQLRRGNPLWYQICQTESRDQVFFLMIPTWRSTAAESHSYKCAYVASVLHLKGLTFSNTCFQSITWHLCLIMMWDQDFSSIFCQVKRNEIISRNNDWRTSDCGSRGSVAADLLVPRISCTFCVDSENPQTRIELLFFPSYDWTDCV